MDNTPYQVLIQYQTEPNTRVYDFHAHVYARNIDEALMLASHEMGLRAAEGPYFAPELMSIVYWEATPEGDQTLKNPSSFPETYDEGEDRAFDEGITSVEVEKDPQRSCCHAQYQ